jgi:hypothetical protein
VGSKSAVVRSRQTKLACEECDELTFELCGECGLCAECCECEEDDDDGSVNEGEGEDAGPRFRS